MLVDISASKLEFCEEEYLVHNNLDKLENVRTSNSFISSSFLSFPETPSIINKTGMPFGLVTKPFANNEKVVEINMGQELLRCNFCKTYINPFFRIENGFFMCNICGQSQIVPELYIQRLQKYEKSNLPVPELYHMSSDFLAPHDYTTRAPQPPCFFFIIDVSTHPSSYVPYVEALGEFLYHRIEYLIKFGGGRTQIGFLSFDKTIQFYHLSPKLRKPKMLVVGDINELFIPIESTQLMTNLEESKSLVRFLVKTLKEGKMFGHGFNTNEKDEEKGEMDYKGCLGAALNIAGAVLGKIGGKLICLTSSYPKIGPLSFEEKDNDFQDVKFMEKRVKFLKLAKIYSREQISIDFHFFSRNSEPFRRIGVAPLSVLSQCTGGQVYYYDYNVFEKREELNNVFRSRLKRLFHNEIGFESEMRIRHSFPDQLELRKYFGCYFLREKDLLIAPVFSGDKSIAVEIGFRRKKKKNEDSKNKKNKNQQQNKKSSKGFSFSKHHHHGGRKSVLSRGGGDHDTFESHLSGEKQVFFQVAVLHTSTLGERKIRVHNYFVPVVTNIRDFVSSMHPNVMSNLLLRIVSKDMLDGGVLKRQKFQEMYLMKKVVQILQCYKRYCTVIGGGERSNQQHQHHQHHHENKKLYPIQLELFVKLVYGSLSNLVFVCERKTIGEKISFLVRMLSNYADVTQLATIPKFYEVLEVELPQQQLEQNEEAEFEEAEEERRRYYFRGLTQRGLQPTGCYLLQTDELLYLFVGHQYITGISEEDVRSMKEIRMIVGSFNRRNQFKKWEVDETVSTMVGTRLMERLEMLGNYHFYNVIPVSMSSCKGLIGEFNRLLIEKNPKRSWADYIQQILVSL